MNYLENKFQKNFVFQTYAKSNGAIKNKMKKG